MFRVSLIFFLVTSLFFCQQALAFPNKSCGWSQMDSWTSVNIQKQLTAEFNKINVLRDAPVGSILGGADKVFSYENATDYKVYCSGFSSFSAEGDGGVVDNVTATGSLAAGTIYSTNVRGVGVIFKLKDDSVFSMIKKARKWPYFPFTGTKDSLFEAIVSDHLPTFSVTLVKTGDIPAGESNLQATARLWGDGSGTMANFRVSGTVIRAECTVPPDAKVINVPMGTVRRSDFKGLKSALEAVSFQIPLTSCVSGMSPNNVSAVSAYLQLDAAKGSSLLVPHEGIVGLTSDSIAKGLGVQILREDGVTPVPLGTSNAIFVVRDGDMMFNLKARYIQVSTDPNGPEPGTANASVNFTLTYK